MDGHTWVEHTIPVAPLYNDVTNFWAATKAHNTPNKTFKKKLKFSD